MSLDPVDVWIESVTGERWSERVRLFETIGELKKRVWRRKRIIPSRQAIVFGGRSLADDAEMDTIGIRAGSTLKLVVVARSGPLTGREREDLLLSDEVSDREHRRQSRRGCSAAEDTSAKESSAGETEREHDVDDDQRKLAKVTGSSTAVNARHTRRARTNSQGTAKDLVTVCGESCSPLIGISCSQPTTAGVSTSSNALSEALEKLENMRVDSGEEVLSEDPSELSSGMIVCDLSNEFRRQKVRRHRHPPAPSTCRQRARSKPRVTHRERSSSDDNDANQPEPVAFALPARRGVSTRAVRSVAIRGGAARCSVCAFRINSAFNCRCGKTLCSRHRAAQSHTCSKIRAKLQQVSD
ncbi:hypothetical protein Q1695_005574 [Nippostrongylus brasiliensis]|nr:hypothetical protein Q1695_005574 [Nippostrongylus brasiliensis]